MADKIKLTPSELQAQASEMRVLKQEYESLFASVTSELGNINRNWSAKLANNFRGKIVGAQKTFSQLTEDLMNGAKVADTCAVTFESVDSQLAKLYCDNTDTNNGISIVSKQDIQNVTDALNWIDEHYNSLPKSVRAVMKDIAKKLSKTGVSAYEVVNKFAKGEYWDAVWKAVGGVAPGFDWDAVAESGNLLNGINWTGLKIKAISIVGQLVTDEEGYIQKNDKKYMSKAEEALCQGDVLGCICDIGGYFVQTVGKGTVDATCQLVSGVVDSVTEKVFGISLSTANAILEDFFGFSPGSFFNDVGNGVSNAVDFVVDSRAKFWGEFSKQAYSDISEFGNVVSNTAKTTSKVISGAISGIGNAIKSWF